MSDHLRQAAQQAVKSQTELLEAWRSWSQDRATASFSAADVPLLQELIFRKIYPINAFELLVQLDREAAVNALLSAYLGSAVDPDSGFGGFQFDMNSMLSDLVTVGGDAALESLIAHADFNRRMLSDTRFITACCEALQIEPTARPAWLTA